MLPLIHTSLFGKDYFTTVTVVKRGSLVDTRQHTVVEIPDNAGHNIYTKAVIKACFASTWILLQSQKYIWR